jgi:putative nucleotidyltransferase with HDIG domain
MDLWHEWRERLRRWAGLSRLKNNKARRILLGGLFFALLTLIMSTQVAPQRLNVLEGEPAPRDVPAPRELINRVATQKKRQAAADRITPLWKVDPSVSDAATQYVNWAFDTVGTVRAQPNQDQTSKVTQLTAQLKLGNVVPETYAALLTAEPGLLAVARQDALKLTKTALTGEVKSATDVSSLRDQVDAEAGSFTMTTKEPWLKMFVRELVKSQIKVNMLEDVQGTQELRDKAAALEDPVIWKKNQLVIKKGEPVTAEQYEMLKDLQIVGPRADFRAYIGSGILSFVLVAMMALYLSRYRGDLLEKDSKLLLLGIIGIGTLLLSLLMKAFEDTLGPGVAYLMPVAVNAMLVSILMDTRAALLQSTIIAMLIGFAAEADPINHALVALVGSTVAVYATARVESRTDVYKAGLWVSLANVVTILGIYLVKAYTLVSVRPWIDAGLGFANGIVTAMVVTGALPMFETLFGIVTPLKLLELSNPNHPLLKKLLVEAPGSYHHTILVANLCEAAAEAIGADQVLARVGAYYHDIGKTKRPYFFVENQFGGENPHDKLPPSLSALIITSHVKDGLEMAREARLPQEIVDFIPEHHGTTLVSYFYHKASQNDGAEYVIEDDFRYEGPKPRTKETAILMLADSCEASVRAIRQKGALTVDQIEQQVKRILDDRLKQGQLDHCDLTLRELDVIAKVFVKVLSGVHHARVEYPDMQGKLPAPAAPAASGAEEVKNGDAGGVDGERSGQSGSDGSAGEPGAEGGGAGPGDGGAPSAQ